MIGDFYERDFYPFSNFAAFKLMWKGHQFDTSEHAYHWEKFNNGTPRAKSIQDFILGGTKSAHEAFETANAMKEFRCSNWDFETANGRLVKVNAMAKIIRAKYDQHAYVRKKLLQAAQDKVILSERSWRDSFWGTGPDGEGEDWMGRLWNEMKDQVRLEGEPTL